VNMSGAVQEFGPVVPTLGSSRPAWKILSALGRILGLDQFEFENITAVREALSPHLAELTSRLSMNDEVDDSDAAIDFNQAVGLERISDVPLYSVDAIVRRAKSLQKTVDAVDVQCAVSDAVAQDLKLTAGDRVRITQAGSSVEASVTVDSSLDQSSVRIPMTSALSRSLGGSFGSIAIEPLQRGVDAA
jgi:NADH-quinone oxidoreductase subunit G